MVPVRPAALTVMRKCRHFGAGLRVAAPRSRAAASRSSSTHWASHWFCSQKQRVEINVLFSENKVSSFFPWLLCSLPLLKVSGVTPDNCVWLGTFIGDAGTSDLGPALPHCSVFLSVIWNPGQTHHYTRRKNFLSRLKYQRIARCRGPLQSSSSYTSVGLDFTDGNILKCRRYPHLGAVLFVRCKSLDFSSKTLHPLPFGLSQWIHTAAAFNPTLPLTSSKWNSCEPFDAPTTVIF